MAKRKLTYKTEKIVYGTTRKILQQMVDRMMYHTGKIKELNYVGNRLQDEYWCLYTDLQALKREVDELKRKTDPNTRVQVFEIPNHKRMEAEPTIQRRAF